ncbi:hypothetical protein [Propionispira arboris]|uniref:hypothetical protein n=1 Tax=Propionispira arboris TaxID=84035 RepID=UPI001C436075|nr:hypothetical protein [Propionispira arboris]
MKQEDEEEVVELSADASRLSHSRKKPINPQGDLWNNTVYKWQANRIRLAKMLKMQHLIKM